MDFDRACNVCIGIMEWWANHTPLSYGEINILLFVIIQPLLIVLFIATTIYNSYRHNRASLFFRHLAIAVLIGSVVATIVLLLLPSTGLLPDGQDKETIRRVKVAEMTSLYIGRMA